MSASEARCLPWTPDDSAKAQAADAARFASGVTFGGDGRLPVQDLFRAFSSLNWIEEKVAVSTGKRDGAMRSLPLMSYRTPAKGRALWLLSGMHGEEPAGPCALAASIADLKVLAMPVVLLPLCNPLGYQHNWRYLNMREWAKGALVHSSGDSDHVLPQHNNPLKLRRDAPICAEAEGLVAHVLKLAKDYPPVLTIDLHEDDKLAQGYIYSQGRLGAQDPIATKVSALLAGAGIPMAKNGMTRFDESIVDGVVSAVGDGSIDELLAADKIIVEGRAAKGPHARTALVVETPAAMPLGKRVCAHQEILKALPDLWQEKP